MNLKISKELREHLTQDIYTVEERSQLLRFLFLVRLYKDNEISTNTDPLGFEPVLEMSANLWDKVILETKLFIPEENGNFKGSIPLFDEDTASEGPKSNETQEVSKLPFNEWIVIFRNLFKEVNIERWGTLSTCKERMKTFMKKNPDVTVDEILTATKIYLANTNRMYVMKSHKFIYDGAGSNLNSTLEEWIDKLREYRGKQEAAQNSSDITEKMQ